MMPKRSIEVKVKADFVDGETYEGIIFGALDDNTLYIHVRLVYDGEYCELFEVYHTHDEILLGILVDLVNVSQNVYCISLMDRERDNFLKMEFDPYRHLE